jgi:RNA polymerase-binding transcription factor DksA
MAPFQETRTKMSSRRVDLLRRVAQIEADLERHGARAEQDRADHSAGHDVLQNFLESLGRELATIESTLHRIDAREYDCCMQCGGTIRSDRLQRLPYAVNCAGCSVHFPLEYIDQLREQSASLRRTLFTVHNVLGDVVDRFAAQEAEPQNFAPVHALLSDLGRQMPIRFRMEEEGGYLAEALDVAPRFARRATLLCSEHGDFVRRIEAVVKEAEVARSTRTEWEAVLIAFRRLSLDVLTHEEAEADILESAFLDDFGASD